MKYLVKATYSPGYVLPEEAFQLLEKTILPSFDKLLEWEAAGLAMGGLPVGERTFVFVMNAPSHENLDEMLRGLPMWGMMEWKTTPLTGFSARAALDRSTLETLG